MIDQMWDEWEIPGVAPLHGVLKVNEKATAGVS